jgi:hypothetical protein
VTQPAGQDAQQEARRTAGAPAMTAAATSEAMQRESSGPEERRLRFSITLLLAAVVAAGVAFRLYLVAATDFPINDGGLFYAFVQAIAKTFPALPPVVTYNGLTIPFAYPPLSFWIGAALTKFGVDPLAVVHVAPIMMNIGYFLLFALVLQRNGRSPLFIALALLFSVVMLRSFIWLVMGGGLSRGLGSIFLMLTLVAVLRPASERCALSNGRLVLAGVAVGGAILSHLEWGIDAAACVILSRALGSPGAKDFVRSNLIAGSAAALVVAPWLLFIYQAHGLAPLFAAGGSSSWSFLAPLGHIVSFVGSSLFNPLFLIGFVIMLGRRDLFWALFMLICMILTPRHSPTPVALALAVFSAQAAISGYHWMAQRLQPRLARGVIGAIVVAVLAVQLAEGKAGRELYGPVPADLRTAMAWVAANHRDSTFAVVTNMPWPIDRSAEWFPILAGARSVNTVQGREWLPHGAFGQWQRLDYVLKNRKKASCAGLLRTLQAFEQPQFIWAEANRNCFLPPEYRPVYRSSEVTIFRVAAPPAMPLSAPRTR